VNCTNLKLNWVIVALQHAQQREFLIANWITGREPV
jgi:hypothetical protein